MSVEVGQPAPDFTLKDQNNQEVSLGDFRGKKVLLVFHPLAFTAPCDGEFCLIRDDLPSLEADDVQVLAVSVDSFYAHKVWSEREGYTFPMLADFWPHGAVAQQYGVFNDEKGFAMRASFVIDREGVVRWKVVNGPGEPRDHSEYAKALADL